MQSNNTIRFYNRWRVLQSWDYIKNLKYQDVIEFLKEDEENCVLVHDKVFSYLGYKPGDFKYLTDVVFK